MGRSSNLDNIGNKNQFNITKKTSRMMLREKIFSKKNSRQGEIQGNGSNNIRSRIASRDERLKVPKSSQSSMNRISIQKPSFKSREKDFKYIVKNIASTANDIK